MTPKQAVQPSLEKILDLNQPSPLKISTGRSAVEESAAKRRVLVNSAPIVLRQMDATAIRLYGRD
jgi:hypothetical protein